MRSGPRVPGGAALREGGHQQIAIMLNSGDTKKTEIAEIFGDANHSPVSKRFKQIEKAAADCFGE